MERSGKTWAIIATSGITSGTTTSRRYGHFGELTACSASFFLNFLRFSWLEEFSQTNFLQTGAAEEQEPSRNAEEQEPSSNEWGAAEDQEPSSNEWGTFNLCCRSRSCSCSSSSSWRCRTPGEYRSVLCSFLWKLPSLTHQVSLSRVDSSMGHTLACYLFIFSQYLHKFQWNST